MNILVADSWLKEYLKTNLTAQEIGRLLPLCGPAVERINKIDNDWVYDIEITTNRPDTASVLGIAREAAAILTHHGHPTSLTLPKISKPKLPTKSLPLKVTINPPSICPRFTAVILDKVEIKPSPRLVQERLIKSGLRPLNNIIDISNYLMLETGQPIHTFDYDKIQGHQMMVRLSKKGEKVVTLDGMERKFPGGDIVIEDGSGRIIDLCGIMGAKNSAIDQNTKRVIFFVQSYDPVLIRRTSMLLAHRTEAAIRFERGIDEEVIMNVVWQGIELASKIADARPASKIYDRYPHPPKPKTVSTTTRFINTRLGVELTGVQIKKILDSLGFKTTLHDQQINALVPSWRHEDIGIPEDLVEEVARIYGYHNLPSNLPVLKQAPPLRTQKFGLESKLKHLLKNWGFSEVYNYSFISDELQQLTGLKEETGIKLQNPLTEEWVWMRPSLIPSVLTNLIHNQDQFDQLKIFEVAHTYHRRPGHLPEEKLRLTIGLTRTDFLQVKGIIIQLFAELGVPQPKFKRKTNRYLETQQAAIICLGHQNVGFLGRLQPHLQTKLGLKQPVFFTQLNLAEILDQATQAKTFQPLPTYPPVIEDLTFIFPPQTPVGPIMESITALTPEINAVQLSSEYQTAKTFRVSYLSKRGNLTSQKVAKIRQLIICAMEKKFSLRLKK